MSDKRKVMVESILTSVRPLRGKNQGMAMTFHTKEVSSEEKVVMMDFQDSHGWLLFAEDEIQEKDIPPDNTDMGGKTPSERLYNVLFVYWKQLKEPGDFQAFRNEKMEQIINSIKKKLF